MPSKLTIKPPRPFSTSPPAQLPPLAPVGSPETKPSTDSNTQPTSPVAPAYSPITPKVQTAFPATYPLPPQNGATYEFVGSDTTAQPPLPSQAIAPAEYVPQPPPQPFSSEDSADAIALRAAISSLQFQKKKAQEDMRVLESVKKRALDDPEVFRTELLAGRLHEQRPKIGDLRAILDETDGDEEEQERENALPGAENERDSKPERPTEIPDSQQTSRPTTSSSANSSPKQNDSAPFDRIPGPQNVVRMPYINWEKYHIHGDALDRMHEQQRRWPGSFDYGQDKGREYAVAAPYSPWHDSIDGQHQRKDSLATPGAMLTPTTVSEHPMETRRGMKHH